VDTEKKLNWKAFDYQSFDEGVCWVAYETPKVDFDVDDYGNGVGHHTGDVEILTALVTIADDQSLSDYLSNGSYAVPEFTIVHDKVLSEGSLLPDDFKVIAGAKDNACCGSEVYF
jgi:hypothetical protein